jgi:hypothetical protein
MLDSESVLRRQVVAFLRAGNAHMSFDEAVEGFPLERIGELPPQTPYTPWHFLEHMRITQWDILEFMRNPDHVSPSFPMGYRPPVSRRPSVDDWQATLNGFRADLEALISIARDPAIDLFADIPHAPGYTTLRELLLAADHNAYALGEFAMLRQAMDAWGETPYLTGKP